MEFQRRVGRGTLSEAVGEAALKVPVVFCDFPQHLQIDKLSRTLGLYQRAAASWSFLGFDAQSAVIAFCEGVNAYLDTNPPLSAEFYLLGLGKPDHWFACFCVVCFVCHLTLCFVIAGRRRTLWFGPR